MGISLFSSQRKFLCPSLLQVANLACSISNNEEGVKLVRMSASQLEALCPQVKYSQQAYSVSSMDFSRVGVSLFY